MRFVVSQNNWFSYLILLVSIGLLVSASKKAVPAFKMDDMGISTDNSFTVESLVRDIFINGSCDNIENINGIGNTQGIGYFENGSSIIGMESGIILSTGPISNAEGGNTATDISGNFADNSGDMDLNILATDEVRDAVGIEFDFVPLDSLVTFRYVFASEEYCEFVGSIFNDVFGFFISGPGIEGTFSNASENVALIPGTDDYVSINSVNHINNPDFYNRNELFEDAFNCEIAHEPSPFLTTFQYDGFTEILTAVLKLRPCETYHIRLVVSDVGDNFYDSAVFLEAESFNIGGAVGLSAVSTINPNNVVNEGCSDGYFLFERQELLTLAEDLVVDYLVSDASTAESGQDFQAFPQTITIPAGEFNAILPVETINDNLDEPIESIIVELDIPCACYSDTAQIFIEDSPDLQISLSNQTICNEDGIILSPQINGGIPGYTYEWSTSDTTSSISINPSQATAYYLTVTDLCGHSLVDTTNVSIFEAPTAHLSGVAEICEGETAELSLEFTGDGPWEVGYTINGSSPSVINNITTSPYSFSVGEGGVYELFAVFDSNCEGIGSGQGEIILASILVDAEVADVSCVDASDGSIVLNLEGGSPPYELLWSNNLGSAEIVRNLGAGNYRLTVTDKDGCEKTADFEIERPSPLETLRYDCSIFASGVIDIQAQGGTPPYLYSTDGLNFQDLRLFESLVPGRTYDIWIQDANGCELVQEFIMPNPEMDMFDLSETEELKLGDIRRLEPTLHIPNSLISEVLWSPSEYLSCSDCLEPEFTAIENMTYSLRIMDNFGCTDEKSISLIVNPLADVYLPNAFSPNGDGINDAFTVFGSPLQIKQVLDFKVFDRWGALLFKAENFPPNEESLGWNGMAKGKELDPGVYIFYAEIELIDGKKVFEKGEVLLVR